MKGLQISKLLAASLGVILANPTLAQNSLDIGVVLDGSYQNEARHWGSRDEGFALGHSELVLSSNIDHHFKGQLVSVLASHGGETELELEEAWIETLSLPFGAKLKAGRMLSNIGYLNSKHMHEDAFVERPAVYRALLGGHYFDDGVQLSWLLPTDFYLQTSFEILSGKSIDAGYKDPVTLGVYTANLQIGADLGVEHSWRWGSVLSTMRMGDNSPLSIPTLHTGMLMIMSMITPDIHMALHSLGETSTVRISPGNGHRKGIIAKVTLGLPVNSGI
ncbi:hypothetical protein [Vibrio tarriae]|uniref:hypothetical protein n=1 Tax=Vibrio tarriae TaxID=2014742 RepID=UPI001E43A821|nr:hypothetical protein [Vibrio tarriae]